MTAKDERAERLAAALRNNLRKRKQQARGEAEAPPPDVNSGSRTTQD